MNNSTNLKKETWQFIKLNFGSCLSWAITFAWLIFIFFKISRGELPSALNEFGDFIAGAFAPLAFFWLVRGFYQQGKGLEQNSEALKMQAEELNQSTIALKSQVDEMQLSIVEQKKFYDLTQAQFLEEKEKYQRLVTPIFEFKNKKMHADPGYKAYLKCEETIWYYVCEIRNHGGKAINIKLKGANDFFLGGMHAFSLKGGLYDLDGEVLHLHFKMPLDDVYDQNGLFRIDFEIQCKNELSQNLYFKYYIIIDKNHIEKRIHDPLSEILSVDNDPYMKEESPPKSS